MKKYPLYIAAICSALVLSIAPAPAVWAGDEEQTGTTNQTTPSSNSNNSSNNNSNPSTGQDICAEYNNDADRDLWVAAGCGTSTTATTFANNLVTVVLSLVGLIAIGVMVFGGIMYTISTGDAAKVQRAKHIIMYGIIGLVVVLLAYAIVYFVSQVVGA